MKIVDPFIDRSIIPSVLCFAHQNNVTTPYLPLSLTRLQTLLSRTTTAGIFPSSVVIMARLTSTIGILLDAIRN
jgi:hypothetical protein